MIKKNLRLMLVALSVTMLAGCGSTQASDAPAGTTSDTVAEASEAGKNSQSSSNGYYTVNSDGKYSYNTSKFDPKKFSGTIYLNNTAVKLPVTYESLAEKNIYVGSTEWFSSEEGYEASFAKKTVDAGSHRTDGLVYKAADADAVRCTNFGTLIIYNPSKEKASYDKCHIGRLDTSGMDINSTTKNACIMFYGEETGKKMYNGDRFTIDTAMELFGAPAVVDKSNVFLVYPYENYVIVVSNSYRDKADLIFIYSWDYFKKESEDLYNIVPSQYRYNH